MRVAAELALCLNTTVLASVEKIRLMVKSANTEGTPGVRTTDLLFKSELEEEECGSQQERKQVSGNNWNVVYGEAIDQPHGDANAK